MKPTVPDPMATGAEAALRVAQSVAIIRQLPMVLIGNGAGAIVGSLALASGHSFGQRLPLVLCILLMLVPIGRSWLRLRRRPVPAAVSRRRIGILTVYSTVLGFMWAGFMLWYLPSAPFEVAAFLIMGCTFLAAGSAAMLHMIPLACAGYASPMLAAAIYLTATSQSSSAFALTLLTLLMSCGVAWMLYGNWKNFEALMMASEEQSRLLQSATQLVRARTEFLEHVSQEIRNPLTSMLGHLSLLRKSEDELPEGRREHLRSMIESGNVLGTLLNDLLDLARLDARQLVLEARPFAVRHLMDEVIAMSRLNADAKQLQLRAEVAEDVPEALMADALRLRQILLNLVINGVKYTDSGSVMLRVRHEAASTAAAQEDAQHGGLLVMEVCDTGRGMPAKMQQRLFTPRAVSDAQRGAGLGLAISHELALLMHGRLRVESTLGKGSTFELRIPVVACALPVRSLDNPRLSRRAVPARILLVDDIAYIRQHLRKLLEPQGFRVDEADCGAAAVRLCDLHSFDLILMDIDLPDFDGVQATRFIREGTSLNKSTPVVAVTGHAASARKADFLNAGMKDCVPKPISRAALLAAVDKWIRVPAAWGTPGIGGPQSYDSV